MKQNLAILGASGMLGTEFRLHAERSGYSVLGFDLPEWDITRPGDLKKAVDSADLIVNCAAYTDVDGAENDSERCFAVNSEAVGRLAELSAAVNKRLLHISTDFVFGDESETPLNEDAEPAPLGVYGMSKAQGEKLLLDSRVPHAVLRVEWTYGANGSNFVSKILELCEAGNPLRVVDDQVGSPTSVSDVSRAILCLLGKKAQGLFHFACKGYASRYEVARYIIEYTGQDLICEPCSSIESHTPAKRPLNSRFDCSRIDRLLDFQRPHWQNSLKAYLQPGSG